MERIRLQKLHYGLYFNRFLLLQKHGFLHDLLIKVFVKTNEKMINVVGLERKLNLSIINKYKNKNSIKKVNKLDNKTNFF